MKTILAGISMAAISMAIAAPVLLTPAAGFAQTDAPPPPPIREPLPPKVQDPDEVIEPEVVIRRDERGTVEEYRSGGKVYMVRIVPAVGPPYYLVDTTGDGLLDFRHEHMDPVKPAHWKVLEW